MSDEIRIDGDRTCYLCHRPLLWDQRTTTWLLPGTTVTSEVHSECKEKLERGEKIVVDVPVKPPAAHVELPQGFPVTDPDEDAPDGAVVDGFERHGMTWEPVPDPPPIPAPPECPFHTASCDNCLRLHTCPYAPEKHYEEE